MYRKINKVTDKINRDKYRILNGKNNCPQIMF